jgi:hypothetical protein
MDAGFNLPLKTNAAGYGPHDYVPGAASQALSIQQSSQSAMPHAHTAPVAGATTSIDLDTSGLDEFLVKPPEMPGPSRNHNHKTL